MRLRIPKFAIDNARNGNKFRGVDITCNENQQTMARTNEARKARFRAALALSGKTAETWAEENGITPSHLSQVLSGKRESRTLMEKVEAFTRKHIRAA